MSESKENKTIVISLEWLGIAIICCAFAYCSIEIDKDETKRLELKYQYGIEETTK